MSLKSRGGHGQDGHFSKGRLEGMGYASYNNGERYEGTFKDGKRSGNGIMTFIEFSKIDGSQQKAIYKGAWRHN